MAKQEISSGNDSSLKKMARDMVNKQEKEIKDLQAFSSQLKAGQKSVTTDNKNEPFHKAMMTSMKREKMADDKKVTIDHSYLEMMIKHHQQGIDMSKTELKNGKDANLKKMAQKIIDEQQPEIKTMQGMLTSKS
jgi:uncharacterized protein (DUF305 family)